MTFQDDFDQDVIFALMKINTLTLDQITGIDDDSQTHLPELIVLQKVSGFWVDSLYGITPDLIQSGLDYMGEDKNYCFGKEL